MAKNAGGIIIGRSLCLAKRASRAPRKAGGRTYGGREILVYLKLGEMMN
jgi:hypothetical protein